MGSKDIVDLCKRHTVYAWTAGSSVSPLPIERAEGVYVWTADGDKLLDLASQSISVNIGHGHPAVRAAMKEAADDLIYAAPSAATRARAELGQLLAEMTPKSFNKFFFTLGGAEANENAIKMAQQFTGRPKIIGRYHSYHGATAATAALGGDPRRRYSPDVPGFLHVPDSESGVGSFGESDAEKIQNYLNYIENVIRLEGPDQIAAMFIESIPGTNGVLIPPAGLLSGLASLLERYEILLVCDEVLTGFGRTGELFAFEHEGIEPDLVTMAKGLSSSYVPLGAVAVSDPIASYFDEHVFGGGLTYNSHPFLLNVAAATLRVLREEGLVENAAALGGYLSSRLEALSARHPCVVGFRSRGLLGALELDTSIANSLWQNPNRPLTDHAKVLVKGLRARGVYAMIRFNILFVCPPLCITEDELGLGLDAIDAELYEMDKLLG